MDMNECLRELESCLLKNKRLNKLASWSEISLLMSFDALVGILFGLVI